MASSELTITIRTRRVWLAWLFMLPYRIANALGVPLYGSPRERQQFFDTLRARMVRLIVTEYWDGKKWRRC